MPIQATIIPIYVLMVHMGLRYAVRPRGYLGPGRAAVAARARHRGHLQCHPDLNNFLFPLALTQSTSAQTLLLALQSFEGEFGIDIPGLMAAVVLSALPSVCLYIVAQRQLVSGLTAGFGR